MRALLLNGLPIVTQRSTLAAATTSSAPSCLNAAAQVLQPPCSNSPASGHSGPWPTFQHHRRLIHTSGRQCLQVRHTARECMHSHPGGQAVRIADRECTPAVHAGCMMDLHRTHSQLCWRTTTPRWASVKVPQTKRSRRHSTRWPSNTTPTQTRCAPWDECLQMLLYSPS